MTVKMTFDRVFNKVTDPEGYPNFTPQQWADRLRSGAYTQAHKSWHDAPPKPGQPEKHCCLAVLATEMGWDVGRNGDLDMSDNWVRGWLRQNKLPEISIFVGWNDGIDDDYTVGSTFAVNRRSAAEPHTFSQIADKIEEYL